MSIKRGTASYRSEALDGLLMLKRLTKPVSNAANGFDGLAIIAEFTPERSDMDVNGSLGRTDFIASCGLQDLLPAKHPARPAGEETENAKLGRRQGDRPSVYPYRMPHG